MWDRIQQKMAGKRSGNHQIGMRRQHASDCGTDNCMCSECQFSHSESAHGKIGIYNLSQLRQPFGTFDYARMKLTTNPTDRRVAFLSDLLSGQSGHDAHVLKGHATLIGGQSART